MGVSVNNQDRSSENLFQALPLVKRARAYRLYDTKGNRYLDFYQNGGYALLGHRAYRLVPVMKNVMSRGLVFDMKSVYKNRLIRALRTLVPGYHCAGIAPSQDAACLIISRLMNRVIKPADIVDPLLSGRNGRISYWRPFCDLHDRTPDVFIPVLPFSIAGAPVVILWKGKGKTFFPDETPISPMILAGMLRAYYDLKKYKIPGWLKEDLFPASVSWKQKGIYIVAGFKRETYTWVFNRFLDEGILLNPVFPGPNIFPAELTPGELKKAIKLFITIPGDKKDDI
ncbi:MAG: hypothetical protein JW881_18020 [Spirochaetales bacterium]|nr:hypothetical protein [Spirochaetales bacterium]